MKRLKRVLSIVFCLVPLLSYAAEEEVDSLKVFFKNLPDGVQRPKVGVVLAGGGAKGAAHIGVLMYLEEMGIPVDYVAGTSMGSIIGGLYALGYSPMDMNRIIKDIDWSFYMSNYVARRDMSVQMKERKNSYLLSIPFGTKSTPNENDKAIEDAETYLKMSGEIVNNEQSSDIIRSLPSGFINGNNLINLFNDLSIGYQDSIDFRDLPIPYACVTTDMLDGSANVIKSGKIAYAMRSSMAIPVVFSPVEYEDKLLVDGGMVNNFPTDVCREMGADIIIGVELVKGFKVDSKEINSLPGMLSQLMSIVTSGHNADNRQICDVYIRPDVSGYGTMSFDAESIDSLVARGYNEAAKNHDALALVKTAVEVNGPVSKTLQGPPAKYLNDGPVRLSSVTYEDADQDMKQWLNRKWGIDLNTDLTSKDLHKSITRMIGTGFFKTVTYALEDNVDGSYRLDVQSEEAEPHRLDLGIRADSEEAVAIGFRVGFNDNKASGPKAAFAGRLSYNPRFEAKGSISIPSLFDLNLYYKYDMSHIRSFDGHDVVSYTKYVDNTVKLYISQFYSRNIAPSIGVEYQQARMDPYISVQEAAQYVGVIDSLSRNAAVFGRLVFDTRNKTTFPTSGLKTELELKYRFFTKDAAHYKDPSFTDSPQNAEIMYTLRGYITPGGGSLTIVPQLFHRSIICDGLYNICLYNMVGGLEQGRYTYQQMPFVGIDGVELNFYKNVSIARCDLRWNFTGKHYLTGMFNYLTSGDSFDEYFSNEYEHSYWGSGLQYSYDSKIGPLSIDAHWSNIQGFGVYLSAGHYF